MSMFQDPSESLGELDAPRAADLIGVSADIALVLDSQGVIRDVCATGEAFSDLDMTRWIGRPWIDTVTVECREKVVKLVTCEAEQASQQRQINQRLDDGTELLVLYSAVPLNADGDRIAVGKDLSSLTRLQQRLVNVQQSMERDYSRLRQFETRYRVLFQSSTEAILIADAATQRIVEANPAVCVLLGSTERKLVGSNLLRWIDEDARPAFETAIASARQDGKNKLLTIGEGSDALTVDLSVFKTDTNGHLLVRLQKAAFEGEEEKLSEQSMRLASLVESAPDGLVVTDANGAVLAANTEFLDLAQLPSAEAAVGSTLSSWLGHGGMDYQIIMASLREHGSIRLYATRMRGEFGAATDVEVSAVPVHVGEVDCIGFAIRDVGRRVMAANDEAGAVTPRSIDQLTQLVGRVPLKELVRESTELIEQLCIHAALKLTNNNRASAAEILGLSRQSLYVKLRRYSLEGEDGSSDS